MRAHGAAGAALCLEADIGSLAASPSLLLIGSYPLRCPDALQLPERGGQDPKEGWPSSARGHIWLACGAHLPQVLMAPVHSQKARSTFPGWLLETAASLARHRHHAGLQGSGGAKLMLVLRPGSVG